MSSRRSEEISFARQGFQEDVQKTTEKAQETANKEQDKVMGLQLELSSQLEELKHAVAGQLAAMSDSMAEAKAVPAASQAEMEIRLADVQSSLEDRFQRVEETQKKDSRHIDSIQTQLQQKLEKAQARLEQQIQAVEEAFARLPGESCGDGGGAGGAGGRASSAVVEAQKLADERRLRMKFDGLQDGLDKHEERLDKIAEQLASAQEAVVGKDAEMLKLSKALKDVDSQGLRLVQMQQEDKARFENHTMHVDKLGKQICELSSKVAGQAYSMTKVEDRVNSGLDNLVNFQTKLHGYSGAMEVVEQKTAALTQRSASCEGSLQHVSVQLSEFEQKLAAAASDAADLRSTLSEAASRSMVKLLKAETEKYSADQAAVSAKVAEQSTAITNLEGKLLESLQKHDEAISDLVQQAGDAADMTAALRTRSADLGEKLALLDGKLRSGVEKMNASNECVNATVSSLAELKVTVQSQQECLSDMEGKTAQVADAYTNLNEVTENLHERCKQHADALQQKADIRVLEDLHEQCTALAGRTSDLDDRFGKVTEQLDDLGARACMLEEAGLSAADEHRLMTEKFAEQECALHKSLSAIEKLQSDSRVLEDLAAQQTAAEEEHLAEMAALKQKLEMQKQELDAMPTAFREQAQQSDSAARERLAELRGELSERLIAQLADLRGEMTGRCTEKVTELRQSLDERNAELAAQVRSLVDASENALAMQAKELKAALQAFEREAQALESRIRELAERQVQCGEQLASRARVKELEEVRREFYNWIEEARKTHDIMTENLSSWLHEAQAAAADHQSKLERHEGWIQHLSAWMEQVRVREQGVTQVLCRVAEKSSPELLRTFEQVLKVPHVSRT
eukprot:TRINITY_DN13330_c0_g1_i2.p1 TRINITY_DN13330_c0_g1~~TRINITY_DN13330_c0_g1_i2.p1  ORF type:complete len:857 (-),score=286.40 TRINITY_DN13330_c0_g1_i2:517-3087(-)